MSIHLDLVSVNIHQCKLRFRRPRFDMENKENVKTVSDNSLNVNIFHTFTFVNSPGVP